MNQPSVYTEEAIINAAFELIRIKGWREVSTRAIAKKLGSSTMPIYSKVGSIEELEEKLLIKAKSLLVAFQRRQYSDEVLLNVAFGYVAFARDEKNLFRFIFQESTEKKTKKEQSGMKMSFLAEFGEDSAEAKALHQIKLAGFDEFVEYNWIFVHGLAMLVNSNNFQGYSDQAILKLLQNAGQAFFEWANKK